MASTNKVSAELLAAAKLALRKQQKSALDADIERLLLAAKATLGSAGVKRLDESDPLIMQACILYAIANFGDVKDANRYMNCYTELETRLALSASYNSEV